MSTNYSIANAEADGNEYAIFILLLIKGNELLQMHICQLDIKFKKFINSREEKDNIFGKNYGYNEQLKHYSFTLYIIPDRKED